MALSVIHYNNIDCVIDTNGYITRESTWHVMRDTGAVATWTDLFAEVQAWAGSIGDDWRLPNSASNGYTEDSTYVIDNISFKALSRYMYEVSYSGKKKNTTATIINEPNITINENNEREKSAIWRINSDGLESFLPAAGDVISWAGSTYRCLGVDASSTGAGEYEVEITAKDMSTLMVGNVRYTENALLEKEKTVTYLVDNDNYETFLTDNAVNSDASAWAGADYYVTGIDVSPVWILGYNITLTAKHISIRLIEVTKDIEFKKFNLLGSPITQTTYSGRWQTTSDGLEELQELIGTDVSDWTEDGQIARKIHPVPQSENEWEVTIETYNPDENTSTSSAGEWDDRTSLITREDPVVSYGEFLVTIEMAGQGFVAGVLTVLSGWTASTDCPFVTSAKLDVGYANKTLPCTIMTATTYLKGEPSNYNSTLINWRSTNYVFSGTIGGVSGSWRKIGQASGERVIDNNGDVYTKVTRSYMLAPGSFSWNSSFKGWG